MKAKIFMLAGGALVLLTGILILLAGWMLAGDGLLGIILGITATGIGAAQIITGAVIMFAGMKYRKQKRWAVVAVFASLIALLSGGGFFVGAVLGLLGGFAGLVEKKRK